MDFDNPKVYGDTFISDGLVLKATKDRIEMVSHLHPDLSMARPGSNTFPAESDYNDGFCKKLGKKKFF